MPDSLELTHRAVGNKLRHVGVPAQTRDDPDRKVETLLVPGKIAAYQRITSSRPLKSDILLSWEGREMRCCSG